MSDQEIDLLFRSHPEKAFELLYTNYYNMLCNWSLRITYDRSSSEDVVQEVILELWNRRDQLKFDTSVIAYLKRSIYNRSLNFIKVKAMNFESDEELVFHEESSVSAVDQLIGNETSQKITGVIEMLPTKCRTVFALSRYEEKSYKEIAEELNISVKTVENQISKALKFIRNEMDK